MLESPRRGDSYKCPQDLFVGVKDSLLFLILYLLKFIIERQIVYNIKVLGNKHYHYNKGPLYYWVDRVFQSLNRLTLVLNMAPFGRPSAP